MHYILFLRVEGFYCRALEEQEPQLKEKPLVIHRDKAVLDANNIARKQNVSRGMSLSEAKAILQIANFVSWDEEPFRKAQAEWLDLLTDVSDVIQPDEQHSAWIDLSGQPDAESLALHVQKTIAKKLSLPVAIGLAPAKWIANLACSHRPSESSLVDEISLREPLTNPAAFLSPIKTRFLIPIDLPDRTRLEFLGYRTIGDVAKVPLETLHGQFGDVATHIRLCARGGFAEPVEALYPPNSLSERMSFDGPVEDLQALDCALQELATRMSAKLSVSDKQSKDLVVYLEVEDGVLVRRRKFTKPIQNFASAISSLRLIVQPYPEKALVSVRVRLENVTHSKRVQQELTGRTDAKERQNGALAAFQHVRTVFGDESILTGKDVVEPRRKQVLRAWRDATGWR